MMCPHCQRTHSGACQPSLLPPPPEWRTELQQRIEMYRTRRAQPRSSPSPTSRAAAASGAAPFLLPAAAASSAPEPDPEPLADPVTAHLRLFRSTAIPIIRRTDPPPAPRSVQSTVPELVPAVDDGGPEAAVESAPVAAPIRPLNRRYQARPAAAEADAADEPMAAPARARLASSRGGPGRRRLHALDAALAPTPSSGPEILQIPLPLAVSAAPAAVTHYPVAPRHLRLRAGAQDAAVILTAAVLFAAAAWAALGRPGPGVHSFRHLLPALVIVPSTLAGLYLSFCAYAGVATWGMRCSGLYVRAFDGPLTLGARRNRAWGCWVSLAALGLGFAWIYCDAQQLTWHDYISRTFVAAEPGPGCE